MLLCKPWRSGGSRPEARGHDNPGRFTCSGVRIGAEVALHRTHFATTQSRVGCIDRLQNGRPPNCRGATDRCTFQDSRICVEFIDLCDLTATNRCARTAISRRHCDDKFDSCWLGVDCPKVHSGDVDLCTFATPPSFRESYDLMGLS